MISRSLILPLVLAAAAAAFAGPTPDAAVPALYNIDALSFPLLVVLVALTSVFTAAHMPAQRLILAEVVGDEESLVARVNAYLDGAQTTAPLVGPALAGVLIAALGPPNMLYVDAATFGVAAIAIPLYAAHRDRCVRLAISAARWSSAVASCGFVDLRAKPCAYHASARAVGDPEFEAATAESAANWTPLTLSPTVVNATDRI